MPPGISPGSSLLREGASVAYCVLHAAGRLRHPVSGLLEQQSGKLLIFIEICALQSFVLPHPQEILDKHDIAWEQTASEWLESEKMWESLYEMEV